LKYKKLKLQICQLWSVVNLFFLNNRIFLKFPGRNVRERNVRGRNVRERNVRGRNVRGRNIRGRNGSGKKWVGEEMGPGRNVGEEMSGKELTREELTIYTERKLWYPQLRIPGLHSYKFNSLYVIAGHND
jgi:hypothetical protein